MQKDEGRDSCTTSKLKKSPTDFSLMSLSKTMNAPPIRVCPSPNLHPPWQPALPSTQQDRHCTPTSSARLHRRLARDLKVRPRNRAHPSYPRHPRLPAISLGVSHQIDRDGREQLVRGPMNGEYVRESRIYFRVQRRAVMEMSVQASKETF